MKAASPPPVQRFHTGRFTVEAVGATDVGLHRDHNEDALGMLPPAYEAAAADRGYLFAVADGMGGAEKGEVASALALDALFAAYYGSPAELSPPEALQAAFIAANEAVHREGLNLEYGMMGTTLVACLILDDAAIVGNVGDSRAYLFREETLDQISEDHSLVAEQVRAGLITPEQARRSSQRNIITRAVGHQSSVDIDQFRVAPLQPGDMVMLCSDGLHGMVEDPGLLRIGVMEHDLVLAAASFIDAANARGGHDNITCLLIRVLAPEGEAARGEVQGMSAAASTTDNATLQRATRARRRRRRALWAGLSGGLGLVLVVGLISLLGPGEALLAGGSDRRSAEPPIDGMQVSGRVLLPPGVSTAPPGVFIGVRGPGGQRTTARVDGEGKFTLNLPATAPAGAYTLEVSPEQWALAADGGATSGGPRQLAVYEPHTLALTQGEARVDANIVYRLVAEPRPTTLARP